LISAVRMENKESKTSNTEHRTSNAERSSTNPELRPTLNATLHVQIANARPLVIRRSVAADLSHLFAFRFAR